MNKNSTGKYTSFLHRTTKNDLENNYQSQKEQVEENLASAKAIRTNFIDSKIENLERKIDSFESDSQKTHIKFCEMLHKIKNDSTENTRRLEIQAVENFNRFCKKRQEQISQIEREFSSKKCQDDNMIRIIDQQTTSAKIEIQREVTDRMKSTNDLKKTFDAELNALAQEVKKECMDSTSTMQQLTNKYSNELQTIAENLNVEISNRVDLHKAVLDMKTDIQIRTKNEIESLSKARVNSQKEVQKMLEIAYSKVSQGV